MFDQSEVTANGADSPPSNPGGSVVPHGTTRFAPIIASVGDIPFTSYHTKYLAYELTRQVGADQADKLAQSLCNATVDLNPHQVDAALLAFRSPLSRGAILADEVGLGKTMEAGLIKSQLWAEHKRRLLVIVPASLRKQWSQEMADKFFIPSLILESKSYRELSRGARSPFDQPSQIVICSYQFARAKAAEIMSVPWDLVVIDEVINFVNRANEADQRVFELLNEKFKLFDGVFGASDEVLGALESGIDFEKRIAEIYKHCRTSDQIQKAFDQLQTDLSEQICSKFESARTKLLENFDEDVHYKLRLRESETKPRLDRYSDWLWALTATELHGLADFDGAPHEFTLRRLPPGLDPAGIPLGRYRLQLPMARPRGEEWPADLHRFRPGHPLAERLIAQAKARTLPPRELLLDYERRGARISLVERLCGQSGWLCADQLTVTSLDTEQTMLLAGVTDDGDFLDRETCEKLLTVPARLGDPVELDGSVRERLDEALRCQVQRILGDAQKRNEVFFDAESDKLDRWADDLKENLEREIKNLEVEIREAKKAKRLAPDLESKIAAQKRINELEQQRNHRKRTLFDAQDEIEQKKDELIAEVESRLQQRTSRQEVFAIRWRVR